MLRFLVSATRPKPDPADLLFGRIFPRLLAQEGQRLRALKGAVEFRLRRTGRVWKLTGGKPPWLTRGPVPGKPDVIITFDRSFPESVVKGGALDVAGFVERGDITIEGELAALGDLLGNIDLKRAMQKRKRP